MPLAVFEKYLGVIPIVLAGLAFIGGVIWIVIILREKIRKIMEKVYGKEDECPKN